MNGLRQISVALMAISLLFSCQKEEEDLSIPEIAFVSISSTQVVEFDNAVSIVISYSDSQGDLGEIDPDNHSLKVKDSRLDNPDWFHIPPITPDQQNLITHGEFSIELPPLFILGNGNQENVTFSIQLRDRNGNWSNTIETPEVIITHE